MPRLGQVTLGVMIAVSAGVVTPMRVAAQSYPIDCAILLCLAGGFPTSVECTAARIEMIRRVTPWPVEPPLQLWNCPLRASGLPSLPNMGSDGLTDEIRGYRDGIEVYHVNYRGQRNSEGIEISDSTPGSYTHLTLPASFVGSVSAWRTRLCGFVTGLGIMVEKRLEQGAALR